MHLPERKIEEAAGAGGGITIKTYTPVTVTNTFGNGA